MNRVRRIVCFALLSTLGTAVAIAATAPTAATNAQQGIANAKVHATVASKVDTVDAIHLHLHHVVNCLEGPHGKQYSAKAEELSAYHCDAIGVGAVSDPAAPAQVRQLAQKAVHEALAGIHANSVQAGHQDADSVIKTLDAAQRAWPAKR